MGCIFPTFYESPSAAPVPRSHFAYVELQNCTKTAFTMAGKKARKNLAKNPFCTSHNPNFLNNWSARLGNTVCKNGCVKRVQYVRPPFFRFAKVQRHVSLESQFTVVHILLLHIALCNTVVFIEDFFQKQSSGA